MDRLCRRRGLSRFFRRQGSDGEGVRRDRLGAFVCPRLEPAEFGYCLEEKQTKISFWIPERFSGHVSTLVPSCWIHPRSLRGPWLTEVSLRMEGNLVHSKAIPSRRPDSHPRQIWSLRVNRIHSQTVGMLRRRLCLQEAVLDEPRCKVDHEGFFCIRSATPRSTHVEQMHEVRGEL